MTYQRARSPEHKEERREAILAAAHELARESSVRNVSLGDIARRVGLAKSNLLRYFQSREDIFLTLLLREWELARGRRGRPGRRRPHAHAGRAPVLLRPAGRAVRGARAQRLRRDRARLPRDLDRARPRAGGRGRRGDGPRDEDAFEVVAAALLLAAGLYPLTNPAPHVIAIYAEEPGLLQPEFEGRLRNLLDAVIAGFRTRA